MSQKWGFLFSEKRFSRFWDCRMNLCKNAHVPFWAILVLKKNVVEVDDVFQIAFGWGGGGGGSFSPEMFFATNGSLFAATVVAATVAATA